MTATQLKHLHAVLTIAWGLMIPIALLTGWISSLVFISAISIYANLGGHFAAWQAARAEEEVAGSDS